MSDNSKINIYVNSINRRSDETASNFSIIIPDRLLKVNNKFNHWLKLEIF